MNFFSLYLASNNIFLHRFRKLELLHIKIISFLLILLISIFFMNAFICYPFLKIHNYSFHQLQKHLTKPNPAFLHTLINPFKSKLTIPKYCIKPQNLLHFLFSKAFSFKKLINTHKKPSIILFTVPISCSNSKINMTYFIHKLYKQIKTLIFRY
jgi:hypothetical protein